MRIMGFVVWEALNALRHYRLRAGLTMLSIVWGVASLMLLLSYGRGFERALTQAFLQIGKDLIVVFPGQTSMQAGGERSGRHIQLELSDVTAILEGVPTVEAASPEARRFLPLNYGYRTRDYSVSGVHACFERIRSMVLSEGRFLSEEDVLHRRRVVVIGAQLKHEMYSGIPALGTELKIQGVSFTVIGILKKKTQITNYEMPDDVTAFIPFTTFSSLINVRYLNDIVLLPANNCFRDRIVADVRAALARKHYFNAKDERAVSIVDWNEFLGLVSNLSLGLKILLTIIGTLTLSIGAVGVMNIMLVSVTERTREIGVLKALGARRNHVLGQILMESLCVTLTGGVIGFLLAVLLTKVIGTLPLLGPIFQDTSGQGDIALAVSWSALAVAGSVLTVVGLIAGFVPALRASRLEPALAIRKE